MADYIRSACQQFKKNMLTNEIIWLKNQLSLKEAEIQKLRNSELEMIHQAKRNQDKLNSIEHIQNKYNM